jgi:hypothetical protein
VPIRKCALVQAVEPQILLFRFTWFAQEFP